jgi:hypothetical protein
VTVNDVEHAPDPAQPAKRTNVLAVGLGAIILLAYLWLLWVGAAIAYSYGLQVIAWATQR